ncbi:hypothetical protein [Paenibacillus taichungensis]|uniref:hypothetical protein n=1 Tax=Paenibacillus taichungensis TaxID=484184 RepID=UPI0035DA5C1A
MLELLMIFMPYILIVIVLIGAIAAVLEAIRYRRGKAKCFPVVPDSQSLDVSKLRWFLNQERLHYQKVSNNYRPRESKEIMHSLNEITNAIKFRQNHRRVKLFTYLVERSQNITNREAAIINAYFVDNMQLDVISEDPEEAEYEMRLVGTKLGENYILLPGVGNVAIRPKKLTEIF